MRLLYHAFLCACIAILLTTPVAAQTKRIYIANDDHTDYMWSANEATYRSAFVTMLDYYLDQANATSGNPTYEQARFNTDGTFWAYIYSQDRASRMAELMNRVRDGHISIPLNTLATVYGGQPTEAIIRGMYYAGKLERQYNVRLPLAVAMENQTMPYGLGTIWAGAGAQYTWKGICNCATDLSDSGNRAREIYWWTGPDDSKILIKWNSMLTGSNEAIGGYAEARDPNSAVNYVDTNTTFKSRWADSLNGSYNVMGMFGKGWDDIQTITTSFVSTAQNYNKLSTTRRVYVSNEIDFFEDFKNSYGTNLPSQSVSFGNDWDLFTASMEEYASKVRRSTELLRSAESMASVISLVIPTFMDQFTAARQDAFIKLSLFWEHCGTDGVTGRMSWLQGLANTYTSHIQSFITQTNSTMGALINKSGTNQRFYVFNPLGWTRTDYADLPFGGTQAMAVFDVTTNTEVPFQLVTVNTTGYTRILASNVPPLGYKVYEIRLTQGTSYPTITTTSNTIENNYYKVTVANRGAITSLIDKTRNNREFIGSRTVNDLGSTTNGTLVVENIGPVSATLRATSPDPVSHITRITLYRDINRIDIQNNITQNFGTNQMWSYGFNLTNPDTYHEELGVINRAKLSTAGGHYSTKNARYDWLTLNHFADMTGSENVGITLSNWDVDFFKLGNSTATTLDTTTPVISAIAGGRLGSVYTTNQTGSTAFLQRFALKTHDAYSPVNAMKMAQEHQNPFITGAVTGGNPHYPETTFSLLSISDPNVLTFAVKPHEDGIAQGLVVRLWNLSSNAVTPQLSFTNRSISYAKYISHIETDNADISGSGTSITLPLNKNQLKTFRLVTTTAAPPNITPSPTKTATPTPIKGDLDSNGVIDYFDLYKLLTVYGLANPLADINASGKVDIFDFSYLITHL